MARSLCFILLILVLGACRQIEQPANQQTFPTRTIVPTAAATSAPSVMVSPDPTAAVTATIAPTQPPTATPTATAVPVTISGDPRGLIIQTPAPNGNAPCGVVDIFDFPLDPPDGRNAAGGRDFGTWRGRFEKYHAGEDWRMASGVNLGQPVFSIGHGLVTYAEPEGWGRDQGVIIIRHTFEDGQTLLSFYGHLDPPSVTLKPGLCVTRGEQIGQIGQPRSRPHLHFEIRSHSPYQTATGYWHEDPLMAGWQPPSQTVWQTRMASARGVKWTYPSPSSSISILGSHSSSSVLLSLEDQLLGLDPASGELTWSAPVVDDHEVAVLDARDPLLYLAGQLGTVRALALPTNQPEDVAALELEPLQSHWSVDFDQVGIPILIPLPEGGVVAIYGDHMLGLTTHGETLWEVEGAARPNDWLIWENQLLLSLVDDRIMTVNADNFNSWSGPSVGQFAMSNGRPILYNRDGVFRIDPIAQKSEQIIGLPGLRSDVADIKSLSTGNIIITNHDSKDRRLILLDDQGEILWQRSIAAAINSQTHLIEINGQAYLIGRNSIGNNEYIDVFHIDLNSGDLIRIFSGGTRAPFETAFDVLLLDSDQMLINFDGQNIVALDPLQAGADIR
ncbi:MAG: M23 family metallopeptidase [Candidatus Promineifilaceae bacterium]|nr:M23 family metallopeptidase [Candidatus Promineifilaceae bacterium]